MQSMTRALAVMLLVVGVGCGDEKAPTDAEQVPAKVACPMADVDLCDRACACMPEGQPCRYLGIIRGSTGRIEPHWFTLESWASCLATVEQKHACDVSLNPPPVGGCPWVFRVMP